MMAALIVSAYQSTDCVPSMKMAENVNGSSNFSGV